MNPPSESPGNGRNSKEYGLTMIATAIVFVGGTIMLANEHDDVRNTGCWIALVAGIVFVAQLVRAGISKLTRLGSTKGTILLAS